MTLWVELPNGRNLMSKLRVLFCFMILTSLSACSIFGGSTDTDDAMGDGNIPLAEPGSELKDVNFGYDSVSIDDSGKSTLRENAQWLLDNPSQKISVEGHCDERGTSEYNLALGERRAQVVKDFLRTSGVVNDRMSTQSYGEELPLDTGHDESAWGRNRRVHFSIKQ